MMLLLPATIYGQRSNSISGRITDENGMPMAGASVVAIQAGAGVATDNGEFALRGRE
ncbi:MAG: carboxypeptidase-like regulatory domain-containing protein [Bacteroidales bacterium]